MVPVAASPCCSRVQALADALKTNTSIRRINLAGNDVSELELVSFPSSVRKRLEGVTTCESHVAGTLSAGLHTWASLKALPQTMLAACADHSA